MNIQESIAYSYALKQVAGSNTGHCSAPVPSPQGALVGLAPPN